MSEEVKQEATEEVVDQQADTTTEDTKEEAVGQPDITVFEHADLYIKCDKCGEESKLSANISGGIQFSLYCTDQHNMRLVCPKCNNSLTLFFKEAENPPVVDVETIEEVGQSEKPVEATQEEVVTKEANNEPVSQDNTVEV